MTQPVLASASSTAVHRFGPCSFFVDDDDDDDVVATAVEKDVVASPFAPAAKDTDDVVGAAAAEVDGVVADVVTGVAEPFTVVISMSMAVSASLPSGSDVDG